MKSEKGAFSDRIAGMMGRRSIARCDGRSLADLAREDDHAQREGAQPSSAERKRRAPGGRPSGASPESRSDWGMRRLGGSMGSVS